MSGPNRRKTALPPITGLPSLAGPPGAGIRGGGNITCIISCAKQPDLNLRHPEVEEALLKSARFWLDRGVDGFRLDVANYYLHDELLRDNPPSGWKAARPYEWQQHLYNRSRPETLEFIRKLRGVLDSYDARMSVAEIFSSEPMQRSIEYIASSDLLHTAYGFHYLQATEISAALLRQPFDEWLDGNAWPSWSFSNHDVPRVVSRWSNDTPSPELAKLLNAILVCLRGTIFLYQGEELGLPQADVPFEKLKDPEAVRFWPETLGRDGCRTPMPWERNHSQAGFSSTDPWLPLEKRHLPLSVDAQETDETSVLQFTRQLLNWRRHHPALVTGDIHFNNTPEPLLYFRRQRGNKTVHCIFNTGANAMAGAALPETSTPEMLAINATVETLLKDRVLPPRSGLIFAG